MTAQSLSDRMTVELDIPRTAAERIAQQDRECQCPICGRLHKHLQAGKPPDALDAKDAALARLKNRIDLRLGDYLCDMRPNYDDSIFGFNEAWNIVRKVFEEAMS